MANIFNRGFWLALVAVVLAGCSSTPEVDHSSRYTIKQDRAPDGDYDVSGLADAEPRYEAPRRAGNKSPYQVWGKSYHVVDSNDGYVKRGIASWYGQKFHGHKTSNGEVFNMYSMSAAHKSLRIPSYARVTNLDNGRSVVVRVNDRGPFHGDRLIDLSYAAAKKLGYQSRGTARVEVAAITVKPDGSMFLAGQPYNPNGETVMAKPAPESVPPEQPAVESVRKALFVQLGAFGSPEPANAMLARAQRELENPVRVRQVSTSSGRFHRVQVGPFGSEDDARYAQSLIESKGFGNSIVLTDTH
ncbi:septal ring lytic transglycosylase RlpA family protein [Marinobacter litoralis]|uniref:septal ring lytic transglycosylase RlpA family protein n=1 Tax=Marinobacter litoralis TaxID=187981 RepID=UPI0018EC2D8B|nr:septal ring lytic transglycosylase RlpA family protein [Marinobacter litoralis]MBJ6138384.1 septal ring lytic transglycosylase RlpA family protein [Marinobacter litoralis]